MIECSCNKANEMLPLFETEKSKQVEKIYFNDKSRKLLGSRYQCKVSFTNVSTWKSEATSMSNISRSW